MLRDFSLQSLFMGLLTAFVGFSGSFAVVLHGLTGAGATEAQATSALMALALGLGFCGLILSIATRLPISTAWSTPGAALLASIGILPGGFPVAVGAFIVCAILIVIAGLWKPLGRAVAAIPTPLASAMLAGVLLGLCLAPVKAIAFDPLLGLPIVIAWIAVGSVRRLLAVPAALLAFVLVLAFGIDIPPGAMSEVARGLVPQPEFVMPVFTVAGFVSIALPLFIVTMASQNIPGIAVLKVNGYEPAPGPLFATTGLFTLFSAPFGGHAVNLAAITAAMCAGNDAHPNPARRYWAAIVSSCCYILVGPFTGAVTAFVNLAPPILIQAVGGLALVGAFSGACVAAFTDPKTREAAAVTFVVTASGVSFAGISGTFWGLLAGGAMLALSRLTSRKAV